MMPILPGICDTDENLEATICATANHGGQFVIVGSLTLADQQRDYFMNVLRERFADMVCLYEACYPSGEYYTEPWGKWQGTARRGQAAGMGVPQGGVGDRGHRAGRGPDLPGDGAEGVGEHRECGAEDGGGG